jgi:hypothetical protein
MDQVGGLREKLGIDAKAVPAIILSAWQADVKYGWVWITSDSCYYCSLDLIDDKELTQADQFDVCT